MNIAILTHPLGANYGGILQAYALTTVFRQKSMMFLFSGEIIACHIPSEY